MTMRRHEDAGAELILDARHVPVLIVTWIGEPTLSLVEVYQQWLVDQVDRAKSGGYDLVSMTDCTFTELPSGKVRKALSEDRAEGGETILKSVLVITSPMIRGALTAIKWMMGDRFGDVEVLDSTQDAISRCLEVLDQHGIAHPNITATSYSIPTERAPLQAKTS